METISTFIAALVAVDWAGLIGAAVASGVGLSFVTQLLKAKWIKIPATRFPRLVSIGLALLVGVISTVATGIELSSITSVVVFTIVAFVTSGIAYDTVRGLLSEARDAEEVHDESMDVKDPEVTTQSVTEPKMISEVADEVIAGEWGAGADRRRNLEAAGHDFESIQAQVRKRLAKK